MKLRNSFKRSGFQVRRRLMRAFSIVEATVGMGVIGTITVSLFSGFGTGLLTMQMARENLRATQIMLEKTETLRLYSWDQIEVLPSPMTFYAKYDPQASEGSQGLTYKVDLFIEPTALTTSYSAEMKQVRVVLTWKTCNIDRTRTFTTYVTRNGLQSYIY